MSLDHGMNGAPILTQADIDQQVQIIFDTVWYGIDTFPYENGMVKKVRVIKDSIASSRYALQLEPKYERPLISRCESTNTQIWTLTIMGGKFVSTMGPYLQIQICFFFLNYNM